MREYTIAVNVALVYILPYTDYFLTDDEIDFSDDNNLKIEFFLLIYLPFINKNR